MEAFWFEVGLCIFCCTTTHFCFASWLWVRKVNEVMLCARLGLIITKKMRFLCNGGFLVRSGALHFLRHKNSLIFCASWLRA